MAIWGAPYGGGVLVASESECEFPAHKELNRLRMISAPK